VIEAYAEIASGFESAEKEALFADTADRVFRLVDAE
jgi:predicted TIM-barrel fold metal-dependent hydrolase